MWFKLDSATLEGQAFLNNAKAGLERTRDNLVLSAELCTNSLISRSVLISPSTREFAPMVIRGMRFFLLKNPQPPGFSTMMSP